MTAQDVQARIEAAVGSWVRRIGARFIVGLFAVSLVVMGVVGLLFYYFDGDVTVPFVSLMPLWMNPLVHLMCGFNIFLILALNKVNKRGIDV
jgi:hypothetical protein